MLLEENAGGGDSVILAPGDDLAMVPESHRHLITPDIQAAFADPPKYYEGVAERCPFPEMQRWLREIVAEGNWTLELNQGYEDWQMTGFRWESDKFQGALLGLPRKWASIPPAVQSFYALVDCVHWSIFGGAGGLESAKKFTPLTELSHLCSEAAIDPTNAFAWGWSGCGDVLIFTSEGRAGWLSHETQEVAWLGTVAEGVDWIFGELLAGRAPNRQYN